MKSFDTNVALRLVVEDDPAQCSAGRLRFSGRPSPAAARSSRQGDRAGRGRPGYSSVALKQKRYAIVERFRARSSTRRARTAIEHDAAVVRRAPDASPAGIDG